jgi:uncharacterized YccA/Bax inhibitor family protein
MPQNPVINKFGQLSGKAGPAPSDMDLQRMYDAPSYTGPRSAVRYMTLDDVVIRTGAMLAVLFAAGAVSWGLSDTRGAGALVAVGAIGSLGLGMYLFFTLKVNAFTALAYSVFQGLFLGAVSRAFNDAFHGIVIQAVTGTVCVAGGMLLVYKTGAIRVTPRFTRMVVGGMIGVFGLVMVNLIASWIHPGGLGLVGNAHPAIAIIFSLVCIGLASSMLIVDFDTIENGIRKGADQKFAWFAAYGLVVALIWIYTEILQLLSLVRE